MFSFTKKKLDGILSFSASANSPGGKDGEPASLDLAKAEEIKKARLSRRGAKLAFQEFSNMFGEKLYEVLPNIWPCTVGGLMSAFQTGACPAALFVQEVAHNHYRVTRTVGPANRQAVWPGCH